MTRHKISIAVFGASGRMGKSVVDLIKSDYAGQTTLEATIDTRSGHPDDLATVGAVIDFSLPDGTSTLLDWMESREGQLPNLLCGTTGLTEEHYERLDRLSEATLVFHATNFSTGVAALSAILKFASPMLDSLSYDTRMIERHHIHKLDAPSGTAKTLAEVLKPLDPASIDIESIREGEVVGDHEVVFTGAADQITIGHSARDRTLFARGAIDAAIWLDQLDQSSGIYTMETYFQARFSS
ncbi:MAG: 4-hydroxy-tetrahydrodipicolinate reductase [Woeseiaceae bacterium]